MLLWHLVASSKYEMVAETELGSNGISSKVDDMNIESMSMNENESDAIVRRALNVKDVRCGKRTDHESVARGVSVFTGTTVTRSEDGEVVKSGRSNMSKGRLDLSKTVRSNVGEDMTNDQGRTKLKAGNDMKNVHSESKCGNIKVKGDEVSIRRPSSDGTTEMSV